MRFKKTRFSDGILNFESFWPCSKLRNGYLRFVKFKTEVSNYAKNIESDVQLESLIDNLLKITPN